jgi:hypothetical protein
MTRFTFLALLTLTVTGCSGATILMHPGTGQVRECHTPECVDEQLRAGFSCVYRDCWEAAPPGAATVFIQRAPSQTPNVATPAPPRRSLKDCQHLPVTEIRGCMGLQP